MAELLWGKVYYRDTFAGFLRQEPGFGSSFIYDSSYLSGVNPPIAHVLPLQKEVFVYQTELPPFFDNLVAEGWLEHAQAKLLGKRIASRFELLLAFGQDCAGAVSVLDPAPEKLTDALIDLNDPKELALLTSRASLSGIQPKLAIIENNNIYYPARMNQLSTYIAKFPSNNHDDLVANEYLSTIAFKTLLPGANVVDMSVGKVFGFDEDVLLIKRFDRQNNARIHFEEFNQLLDQPSNAKYFGDYGDLANFIRDTPDCLNAEIYNLFSYILAGLLIGNTDMHLKNFAMLHTASGLRLSPVYDQVCAGLYGYKQLALAINKKENVLLYDLAPEDILKLGAQFGLNKQSVDMVLHTFRKNYANLTPAIMAATFGTDVLKNRIINLVDKVWNKTFASIGN